MYGADIDAGASGAQLQASDCTEWFLGAVAGITGGVAIFASSAADGPIGIIAGIAALAAGVYAYDQWAANCTSWVSSAWAGFCAAVYWLGCSDPP